MCGPSGRESARDQIGSAEGLFAETIDYSLRIEHCRRRRRWKPARAQREPRRSHDGTAPNGRSRARFRTDLPRRRLRRDLGAGRQHRDCGAQARGRRGQYGLPPCDHHSPPPDTLTPMSASICAPHILVLPWISMGIISKVTPTPVTRYGSVQAVLAHYKESRYDPRRGGPAGAGSGRGADYPPTHRLTGQRGTFRYNPHIYRGPVRRSFRERPRS